MTTMQVPDQAAKAAELNRAIWDARQERSELAEEGRLQGAAADYAAI